MPAELNLEQLIEQFDFLLSITRHNITELRKQMLKVAKYRAGEEVELLRDQVAELQDALGVNDADMFPAPLANHERKILGLMIRREMATIPAIIALLWGHKPECDRPNYIMRNVYLKISHMRKKLKKLDIEISNQQGSKGDAGKYFLDRKNKRKVIDLIVEERRKNKALVEFSTLHRAQPHRIAA